MSSNETVLNNGRQLFVNYDTSKIFIWNNRTNRETYTNTGYSAVTLNAGTVMGRITANGKVVPLNPSASDGSELPCGILADNLVVDAGDSVTLTVCHDGDVDQNKIIWPNSSNIDHTKSGRRYGDWLKVLGINVVPSTENTGYDNQ